MGYASTIVSRVSSGISFLEGEAQKLDSPPVVNREECFLQHIPRDVPRNEGMSLGMRGCP